jgi:polyphosphate kinase
VVAPADLSSEQREAARRHFVRSVFPALTPLALDPGHPFPRLRMRALNLAVSLQRREGRQRRRSGPPLLAVILVPAALPRVVRLPSASGDVCALLEEIIAACAGELFPGHAVGEIAVFRVTRGGSPGGQDGDAEQPPPAMARGRRRGERCALRLEIASSASRELEAALAGALELEPRDVHRVHGFPIDEAR